VCDYVLAAAQIQVLVRSRAMLLARGDVGLAQRAVVDFGGRWSAPPFWRWPRRRGGESNSVLVAINEKISRNLRRGNAASTRFRLDVIVLYVTPPRPTPSPLLGFSR